MYCPNSISHVVVQGDSLYQLAKYYQTTISKILMQNPNVDPYNLTIGTTLLICPGETFSMHPSHTQLSECPNMLEEIRLMNHMRLVWSQHVYWTRMLIISIAERLNDLSEVTARLLRNPQDIAAIYEEYYSKDVADAIARLLTEHLQIGAELVTALRDGRSAEADALTREWFDNADRMAEAFAGINPFYSQDDVRRMLYNHLELLTNVVAMRLAGNYQADIEAFDEVEREAMLMADYFSIGLIRQFPQRFNMDE